MKIVEFPKNDEDKKTALDFLDEVRIRAEENEVTSLVVVMKNDEGHLGVSLYADYLEAVGILALALRDI